MNDENAQRRRRPYVAPTLTVSFVRLESSICGGSTIISASSPYASSADAQTVNKDFSDANDFTSSSWDEAPAN